MENVTNIWEQASFSWHPFDVYLVSGLVFLALVVVVVGVPGNILLIISVFRKADLRTSPTFVILASLGLDDLLLVLSCPAGALFIIYEADAGDLFYYFVYCTTAISIYHLLAFSVVRYLILTRPFFAHCYLTAKNVGWTCAAIWIIILASGTFAFESVGLISFNTTDNVTYSTCLPKTKSELYLGLVATFGCYIPLALIAAFHLVKVIKLKQNKIQSTSKTARRQVSPRIVLAILISLLVTWLPFNCYLTVLYIFDVGISAKVRVLEMFLCSLIFGNSAIHPILYFFMSRQRRTGMLSMFGAQSSKELRLDICQCNTVTL